MADGTFGAFDGLDNRRDLMDNLDRLGHGLNEYDGGMRRAKFLHSLFIEADPFWQGKPIKVDPCSTVDAYFLLVALVSGFRVDIEEAARRLESLARTA